MEPSSIGFLILMAAMGGGIAYFADKVGKKLGKKRLSVFGLRPKHTATLGTICLGVLVTIVTIGMALLFSSGISEALLHGKKIRQDLTNLETEVRARTTKNSDLANRNNGLLTKIAATSKDLLAKQAELTTAQQHLEDLNKQIGDLRSKISVLTADASQKRLALAKANKQLAFSHRDLKQVREDLDLNRKKLSGVEKDNQAVIKRNEDLENEQEKLIKAQEKIVADKTKLEGDLAKIKRDVADLQSAEAIAQSDLEKSKRDLTDVEAQLESAKRTLKTTRSDLDDAEKTLGVLKNISDVSRSQPVTYKIGEEVTRLKVPAGVSQNAANGAVTLLLRRARIAAQQRGSPRAVIFDHGSVPADQLVRLVLTQLTGSDVPKVIIASSQFNAFRGESVSLDVSVAPDPLVYISGQMVAETVIEANRGSDVIYQELQSFLQEKVSQKAKKDGMIPVLNSDVSFGQISYTDVLQVVEQLRTANRPIRLEAHAIGDTYAADSLRLEFRLR